MKSKLKELDVDFMGNGAPLTIEEELRISEVIRDLKEKQKKIASTKKNPSKNRPSSATDRFRKTKTRNRTVEKTGGLDKIKPELY